MSAPVCVLDASVGVKWFRDERGSDDARGLVERHIAGDIVIATDSLFIYEVMSAASRDRCPADAIRIWEDLTRLDLVTVPIGDELVRAAVAVRESLGCTLYDSFAPGLAMLLGAPLYSADARAHSGYEGVRLVGA